MNKFDPQTVAENQCGLRTFHNKFQDFKALHL
jgi:hypothetical protein